MSDKNIFKKEVWGIIPARGGSKSIPLKNLAQLYGRPLIEYVIRAGQASDSICRLICSTDNEKISEFCKEKKVEVKARPRELATDVSATKDALLNLARTILEEEGAVAEIFVLLEPTYPFILPRHIDDCVKILRSNAKAGSVQSVVPVPHNHHAYNQRYLTGSGCIDFRFKEEREKFYNKQLKPAFFVHGNLFVFKAQTLLETKDIYGEKSLPYFIPKVYSFDVDGPDDLKIAECILKCKGIDII